MLSKKIREIFPHIILILVSLILGMLIFNLVYSKTPLDTKVVLNRKAVVEGMGPNLSFESIDQIQETKEEIIASLETFILDKSDEISQYDTIKNSIQTDPLYANLNLDDYQFTQIDATSTTGGSIQSNPYTTSASQV